MSAEPWKSRRPWPLLVPLGVYALLLAWIGFSAASVEGYDFSYLLYALTNLIVFTDAIDFGLRLYVHRRHTAVTADLSRGAVWQLSIDLPAAQRKFGRPITARAACRPYAIIASIYNLEDEVDEFMERLEPHRDHVWLISDGSTDRTARRLQQWGWRCLDEEENRHKPAALRHLLQTLPPQIETVMVIDPDVKICGRHEGSVVDLERAIADLQQSGAAAACPLCNVQLHRLHGRARTRAARAQDRERSAAPRERRGDTRQSIRARSTADGPSDQPGVLRGRDRQLPGPRCDRAVHGRAQTGARVRRTHPADLLPLCPRAHRSDHRRIRQLGSAAAVGPADLPGPLPGARRRPDGPPAAPQAAPQRLRHSHTLSARRMRRCSRG